MLIVADLIIGFRMFRERFTSRVTLDPPRRIDVAYTEGPFRYLEQSLGLRARSPGGCRIDFFVDFEFKSRLLQTRHRDAVQRGGAPHGRRLRDPRRAALRPLSA